MPRRERRRRARARRRLYTIVEMWDHRNGTVVRFVKMEGGLRFLSATDVYDRFPFIVHSPPGELPHHPVDQRRPDRGPYRRHDRRPPPQ